jgi:hypothetical protein
LNQLPWDRQKLAAAACNRFGSQHGLHKVKQQSGESSKKRHSHGNHKRQQSLSCRDYECNNVTEQRPVRLRVLASTSLVAQINMLQGVTVHVPFMR